MIYMMCDECGECDDPKMNHLDLWVREVIMWYDCDQDRRGWNECD